MAEAQAVAETSVPQDTGAGDAANRAARVQGIINAILASPSLAAIQAALLDPDTNAAALSDTGTSVMVAALAGASASEQIKQQVRDLQPANEERRQILEGIGAKVEVETPAAATPPAPVVVTGAENGTAAAVASAPIVEGGSTFVAASSGAIENRSEGTSEAVAGGVAATIVPPAATNPIPSILQPKPPVGGSVAVAPRTTTLGK